MDPQARTLRLDELLAHAGGAPLQWTARRGLQGTPRALDEHERFELVATGENSQLLLAGAGEDGGRLELGAFDIPARGTASIELR